MGLLVDGVWQERWYDTEASGGAFVRARSTFRDRVEADPGARHPAAPGRYHLYVSLACPWASRTLVFRKLKGLEDAISLSIVDPVMGPGGWTFTTAPGCIPDTVNGCRYLHEVYRLAKPDYTGRVTVPVLWDKVARTIVNNESADIIRMLNSAFDAFATRALPDQYPEALRPRIDALNARIYDTVNDGVYKAGFATRQDKYEAAVAALFATLDDLERLLAGQRYLCGAAFTEADWRLFTTLVRFDAVYYGHFKCNLRRLVDYPNLWAYTRDLFQTPGVAETVNLDHIKTHYYRSHRTINPTGIVPVGPVIDFSAPHGRERLSGAAA
ncbi:MAG: glutathione S-transferase family protein [Rhodospirillaceae bacterium]|nr:glutathione S-transferase family protein [Rhodospirillaceae bacterium]